MARTPSKRKGAGRPTDYCEVTAAEICQRIADGADLKTICAAPDMPARSSVYLWLGKYPEFSAMYARAREERADLIADEIVSIADDEADPQKARVRMDARKWWAAKVNPKKYGDKVEHNGPDGGPILISWQQGDGRA